jgi:outer membrane protein TolC
MKPIRLFFLTSCFLLWNQGILSAQVEQEFTLYTDDISHFLPPLSELMDSAMANNHTVQFRDLQLIIDRCKLKANKKEWTRNLGIQADIRYGTFDNYSTNSTTDQSLSTYATTRNEFKWGYAAYINMPLYTLVNRKNQMKLATTELEQAKKMAEAQRDEVRQLVIRQYHDVILKQRLLKIKSKLRETSAINMQMTEKDFANGVIQTSEYARISEIVSRAEADFESAQIDFQTSYLILEEIVGMKFKRTNVTQP